MKVIKVHGARSIWLFDTGLLNPRGVSFFHLVDDLAQEFGFIDFPGRDEFTTTGKGIKFDNGVYSAMGEETNVALEIFDDGFVANSRHSTDLCDLFLDEVLGWIGKRFDVNHRSIQIRERMYRSELVVAMDHSLADVCAAIDQMSRTITPYFHTTQELTALHFGSETKHSAFTFERRADEPFAHNNFYSAATLPTESHEKALAGLEACFAEKG